jgi:hypothetical protein
MSESVSASGSGSISVRFHVGMLAAFLVIIVVFSGIVLFNTYRESADVARQTAAEVFSRTSDRILERLNLILSQAELVADSASRMPSMQAPVERDGLPHEGLDYIVATLAKREGIYSIYFGHADGSFLQVIAPRGQADVLAQHRAPPETVFIVRAISKDWTGRRVEYWRFLDEARHVIGARTNRDPSYDPRIRPWYGPALSTDNVVNSEPYIFASLQAFGVTASHRLRDRGGVLGVDFAFTNLRDFLQSQRLSNNGTLVLFDHGNRLIAAADPRRDDSAGDLVERFDLAHSDNPLFRTVVELKDGGVLGQPQFIDVDGLQHLFRIAALPLGSGTNLYLAAIGPFSDFTRHIDEMQRRIVIVTVILLIAVVPFVLLLTRRLSRTLETLAGEAADIQRLEFVETPVLRSIIREVDQLGGAFSLMKRTIGQRTQALKETQKKLEKLVERSISLSAEKDIQRLYALVLQTARELSQAEGAVLLLLDRNKVYCEMAEIGQRELRLGPEAGSGGPAVSVPIAEAREHPILAGFIAGGPTVSIDDIATAADPVIDLVRGVDERAGYRTRSLLLAPLRPNPGAITGMIALMNAQDEAGKTVVFAPDAFGFVESLASQVAIVEEVRRHQIYLEETVKQRTVELRDALEVIGDSIRYASRIQRSILPDAAQLGQSFAESFVLWEPRDVVGGDIYWCRRWGDGTLLILADCTGHGVPGAFMSLIATGALYLGMRVIEPGDTAALTGFMHRYIQSGLNQDHPGGESDDGLELAMVYLPPDGGRLLFTGAGLSLFYSDGEGVQQVAGGRAGLGYRGIEHGTTYRAETVAAPKGRRFYLTTDGAIQQVGGAKGRSFGTRRFKTLLASPRCGALSGQGRQILEELIAYQGEQLRRDDVTVIGFAL